MADARSAPPPAAPERPGQNGGSEQGRKWKVEPSTTGRGAPPAQKPPMVPQNRRGMWLGLIAGFLVLNLVATVRELFFYLVLFALASLLLWLRASLTERRTAWQTRRVTENLDVPASIMRSGVIFTAISIGLAWVLTTVAVAAPLTAAPPSETKIRSDSRERLAEGRERRAEGRERLEAAEREVAARRTRARRADQLVRIGAVSESSARVAERQLRAAEEAAIAARRALDRSQP